MSKKKGALGVLVAMLFVAALWVWYATEWGAGRDIPQLLMVGGLAVLAISRLRARRQAR